MVTMHRSNLDLCPVRAWDDILSRIMSYPNATAKLPVNTILYGKTFVQIRSIEILKFIRHTVDVLGVDTLGFTSSEVGTHSIISSTAMQLYLQKASVYTIILIGRWSRDAFLIYIRRQVKEFSKGLSSGMIQAGEFYTIPECSRENPRIIPHLNNSSATIASSNGPTRQSSVATQPKFNIFS